MSLALSMGLMGAAQGLLQGIQTQRQQDQEDIKTKELAAAKLQEEQALLQMKSQYNSAENLQKIQAQMQADLTTGAQKAQSDATLLGKKQAFDATQKAQDRASGIQRAGIYAGATLGAAHIRADAEGLRQSSVHIPTSSQLKDVLGTSDPNAPFGGTVDPAQSRVVLAWLSAHPGKTLADYVARAPVGSPGTVAPDVPLPIPLNGPGSPSPAAVPQPAAVSQPAVTPSPAVSAPPMPGAQQAPDGNWYIPDPSRPGKYQKVG